MTNASPDDHVFRGALQQQLLDDLKALDTFIADIQPQTARDSDSLERIVNQITAARRELQRLIGSGDILAERLKQSLPGYCLMTVPEQMMRSDHILEKERLLEKVRKKVASPNSSAPTAQPAAAAASVTPPAQLAAAVPAGAPQAAAAGAPIGSAPASPTLPPGIARPAALAGSSAIPPPAPSTAPPATPAAASVTSPVRSASASGVHSAAGHGHPVVYNGIVSHHPHPNGATAEHVRQSAQEKYALLQRIMPGNSFLLSVMRNLLRKALPAAPANSHGDTLQDAGHAPAPGAHDAPQAPAAEHPIHEPPKEREKPGKAGEDAHGAKDAQGHAEKTKPDAKTATKGHHAVAGHH